MNESLLWLLYLVSAAAAFVAIMKLGWRIVPAMFAGTLITVAGWALLYFLTTADERPAWWKLDLSLNACFGLIFAAAGAALAHLIRFRQREP